MDAMVGKEAMGEQHWQANHSSYSLTWLSAPAAETADSAKARQ